MIEGEKRGYQFALEQSKANKHAANYKKLVKLGSPPYPSLLKTSQFRQVLDYYGGFEYQKRYSLWNDIKEMFDSKHYSLMDIYKWLKGINYLTTYLREEMVTTNFMEQVKRIEVPVYFLAGQFDYVTPTSLVEEYMEILESPHKELIVFENTAHDCHFEKPDEFVKFCTKLLQS